MSFADQNSEIKPFRSTTNDEKMEFTHRTLLRHGAVSLVLLGLPFAFMLPINALFWYYFHAWFFAGLLGLALGIGILAQTAVSRGVPADAWSSYFARCHPHENESAPPPQKFYYWRLVYTWSSCSRCVAYWCAGFLGAALSLLYWPMLAHPVWTIVLRTSYFAVLAASFAAAVAVLLHFISKATPES